MGDSDCTTTTPVADYRVAKSVDVTRAAPGDTVNYRITIANTGRVPYTADTPASFVDDLTAVLDDARYDGDATAGAVFGGTHLSWTGALPVGETVIVRYSVTIDEPDSGDGVMTNVVITPDDPRDPPGGDCPKGSTDSNCSTTTTIRPPVTVGPTSSATTPVGIPTTAPPTPSSTGPTGSLPDTGTQVGPGWLLIGFLMVVGGGAMVRIGRRRRSGA
jgi:uncharacterized repeat protein (TIGR01451 family)/LPXTG-motif cell wall-anchored protein